MIREKLDFIKIIKNESFFINTDRNLIKCYKLQSCKLFII